MKSIYLMKLSKGKNRMRKVKYLILGGGPTGLTIANLFLQAGETSFLLLEKEDEVGGLCRSQMVDGSELDIGGGHFLDVKREKVNEFLFQFMPEREWNLFGRNSKICLDDRNVVDHPLEANIWQMSVEKQIEYLQPIAKSGANLGKEMPSKFVDWITWKLGEVIAKEYMLPYNQKMFGDNLNELGTYWLEKLPNVSFEDTLRSCLMKKSYGTQPGHASFYYPKEFGYGELWRRMGKEIGNHLEVNTIVTELNVLDKVVKTNKGEQIEAEVVISTVPWTSFEKIEGISTKLTSKIKQLKHSSIQVEYYEEEMDTDAHWIYYPDLELPHHRILVRHNFCTNSKGYWTETRAERVKESNSLFSYTNEYAYPLNTLEKPTIMGELLAYMREHEIYGVGRWGEHEHYNSDVTVGRAIEFFEEIVKVEGDE